MKTTVADNPAAVAQLEAVKTQAQGMIADSSGTATPPPAAAA